MYAPLQVATRGACSEGGCSSGSLVCVGKKKHIILIICFFFLIFFTIKIFLYIKFFQIIILLLVRSIISQLYGIFSNNSNVLLR
jgi:hypothetical protein